MLYTKYVKKNIFLEIILKIEVKLTKRKVLLSLLVLMSCPDEKDFLNIEAAGLWQKDPTAARKKAADWTKIYARK